MRVTGPLAVLAILGSATSAHADRGDRWDPATVGIQTVSGAVGAGAASMAVFYLASRNCKGLDCLGAFVPAAAGGVLGLIVGVWGAGRILDGTGSFVGTTVGAAGGVAGAIAVGALISAIHPKSDRWYLTTLLPVFAGTILGYQLSADRDAPTSARMMSLSLAF